MIRNLGMRVAVLLPLLLLGACGGGGPALAPAEPAAFSLSESSAGPITAETAYSKAALSRMLPQFRFDTVQTVADGRVRYLLAGFDEDGFQAFQVEANGDRSRVDSVHVVGTAVHGPRGEEIGITHAQAGGRSLDCKPGRGPWFGMAVCQRRGSKITYIFSPEEYSATPDRLPRGEDLARSRLVRMIWEA